MKINELFKKKRTDLSLSQEDLAKKFHCSRVAISDIERGITNSLSFEMIEWLFESSIPDSVEERIEYLEAKMEEVTGFLNL